MCPCIDPKEEKLRKANAKSILGILTLGVFQGIEITIAADGNDEEDAVKALVELVENNFGGRGMKKLNGVAASRGICIGPAFQFVRIELKTEKKEILDTKTELIRLDDALSCAKKPDRNDLPKSSY